MIVDDEKRAKKTRAYIHDRRVREIFMQCNYLCANRFFLAPDCQSNSEIVSIDKNAKKFHTTQADENKTKTHNIHTHRWMMIVEQKKIVQPILLRAHCTI